MQPTLPLRPITKLWEFASASTEWCVAVFASMLCVQHSILPVLTWCRAVWEEYVLTLNLTCLKSTNLDKSLDDIISTKRKQTPRSRPKANSAKKAKGAKAAALGGSAAAAVSNANRQQPPVVFPGRNQKQKGSKVIVSNLPIDVSEAQVKVCIYCGTTNVQELFSTTIGPLRRALMSYKANGQSTGVCTVEFQRAEDANRAYAQYNNRLIDSKRPLKIEVVVDPAAATSAQAAKPQAANKVSKKKAAKARGNKQAGGQPKKTPTTFEDLDAEMEEYAKQGAAENAPMQDAQPAA
ncbi:RNA-binding RNA annealing protein [Malassezia psittaci]|uniref:RNA-binding RNA annealing protein n=1 Tax=Malassezia psittaci TaxID=1821823 RepID=A0AAF0F714_9BASI|nr:RNA-binding RNA annealing protein [Malassezia psittaci]